MDYDGWGFLFFFFSFKLPSLQLFHFLSELMEINGITSAQTTVGSLTVLTRWYVHVCLFVSVSAHSCAGIIPTCWGLFAKIRRRRPGYVKCSHHASLHAWATHAHSSSPHYRLPPSYYLSHAHTLSFLVSHSVCVSFSLSVISLFMFDLFAVLHQLMMVQG